MSSKFEDLFPGCQGAVNEAVRKGIDGGLSREGLAIAMIMIGAEMLFHAGGPQLAATTLRAMTKYVGEDLPTRLAELERGDRPLNRAFRGAVLHQAHSLDRAADGRASPSDPSNGSPMGRARWS